MKCLAYECQNEANKGFPCCSVDCGYEYKTIPQQIKKVQDLLGRWTERVMGLRNKSLGEIIYYTNL